MKFSELYIMLNSEEHFNKGLEVEVLKGFYQKLPWYAFGKKGYRAIRLQSYKTNK